MFASTCMMFTSMHVDLSTKETCDQTSGFEKTRLLIRLVMYIKSKSQSRCPFFDDKNRQDGRFIGAQAYGLHLNVISWCFSQPDWHITLNQRTAYDHQQMVIHLIIDIGHHKKKDLKRGRILLRDGLVQAEK